MPARRSRGEGALYWDESRQRWMAAVDVGFSPTGKRQRRWVTGKTKTEAKQKLLALLRDQSDGLPTEHRTYTVREAVESWLEHGLIGRDEHTVTNRTILARAHVIPALGNRRLVDLTSEEIDAWLAAKSETLSTDTLHRLLSILRRSIRNDGLISGVGTPCDWFGEVHLRGPFGPGSCRRAIRSVSTERPRRASGPDLTDRVTSFGSS
jgi:hypothetical protein